VRSEEKGLGKRFGKVTQLHAPPKEETTWAHVNSLERIVAAVVPFPRATAKGTSIGSRVGKMHPTATPPVAGIPEPPSPTPYLLQSARAIRLQEEGAHCPEGYVAIFACASAR